MNNTSFSYRYNEAHYKWFEKYKYEIYYSNNIAVFIILLLHFTSLHFTIPRSHPHTSPLHWGGYP